MTTQRPAVGWGVALVAVGAVVLLRNTGVIAPDVAGPLLVITAGLLVLSLGLAAGRHDQHDQDVTSASLRLDGSTSARVRLTYGAGTLRVTGGAEPGVLYDGTFAGGIRQDVRRIGDRLELAVGHASDAPRMVGWRQPLDWHLRLTEAVPLDLEIATGASRVDCDLSRLRVRSLKVETGASDVDVVLPAHGICRVEIEAGAADVKVRVPDGVAAQVRTSTALASVAIDAARFPPVDGAHRSPDYDTAADRTDIRIDGGLAAFAVR